MPAPVDLPPPVIPTVEEAPTIDVVLAGHALGIRARTSYELAKTGQLVDGVPVLRVGAKFRVPTAAVRRVLGLDGPPGKSSTTRTRKR